MPFDSRRYVFWELLYDDHGEYVALGLNDSDAELRGDSKQLKVDFTKVAYHTARLRIRDPTTREFEPLLPQVSPGQLDPILNYVVSHKSGIFTLRSESVPGQSFGVYLRSIIYTNGTRQVVIKIPSARLFYGLQGRHGAPFVNASQWSRHAFYGADSVQTRAKEGMFSSVHPFVVIATNNSNITLGLFLLNSNDVVMTLSPARLVTFRTSGGILDLFFFFGPDPQSVVRQYLRVVGYPAMPLPALLLRGPHTKGVPILDGSFTSGSLPPTHPEARNAR
ncbi:lysosomal alpha-glucosidase-like [Amblyomma americanum]